MAGVERWIAGEDAGRYRDALAIVLPAGLPAAFLQTSSDPLESLVHRWSRTHGPFLAAPVAARWGLPTAAVEVTLRALEARGLVLQGAMLPGTAGVEWCDPDVLRRLRQRSLATLRSEIAPVDPEVYGRFLPQWHGISVVGGHGGFVRLQEVLAQLEGVPLPYSILESEILPARIIDFQPRMLDELGAMGGVVWIGRGALGPKDGRIALYRRNRVPLLVDVPTELPAQGTLQERIYTHLTTRGASFMVELQTAIDGVSLTDLTSALWDLVWMGLVTNDTFLPLRNFVTKKGTPTRTTLRGRDNGRTTWSVGGRWSAVATLIGKPPDPTLRAHARATLLLERYGVASAAAAQADGIPGGFSAVYPVFRAMEDAGRARRGFFVDGLGGAQFALSGAVDRLRASRQAEDGAIVLPAADPANAWGVLIPWPTRPVEGPKPRRVAGAQVVLVGGLPVLFVDKGEKSWITLPAAEDLAVLARAVTAWIERPGGRRFKTFRIDKIDGMVATESPLVDAFLEAGFVAGYQCLERPVK